MMNAKNASAAMTYAGSSLVLGCRGGGIENGIGADIGARGGGGRAASGGWAGHEGGSNGGAACRTWSLGGGNAGAPTIATVCS